VATRDLAAGTRLAGGDLQVKAWPERVRPPDALGRTTQAVGQRLAGPIRAGEPLTSTRLVGADLTAGLPPTMRALPVEITGSASLSLVHAGDSIDLVVGDPPEAETGPSRSARVLAESVRVLAVARQTTDPGGDLETLGLIVAAEPATALKIASAAGRPIVATVRKPP
jgi:Flp pilus assembly protein CpaB